MLKKKTLAIVATVSGLAGLAPEVAGETATDARVEALEQRIRELEERLEKADQANTVSEDKTTEPQIRQLDQKVKVIERKLEVEKEVSEANWAKLPKFELGRQGLRVETQDGNFKMNLRALIQADGRFFIGDGASLTDQFLMRRVRPIFLGTVYKYFDYRIMPDFAGSQTRLFDAYLDIRYLREASLTAGKYKAPMSLERLQSASNLAFTERAYPTQLAPNRDIGVMLHGEFDKPGFPEAQRSYNLYNFPEFFAYQVGVFDGAPNNGNIDGDTNDSKEFEGRIFVHPFLHSGIDPLEGFGVGIAGSWGQPSNEQLPGYVSIGQNTIFTYAARADGTRSRIYPQLYWYWGPFGLMGEYAIFNQELANQARTLNENDQAWNVTVSYVLTGEDNTYFGVRPRRAFDPFHGNWGAFQLAARGTGINFDDSLFQNVGTAQRPNYPFANPRASVSAATTWGLGVNWWLNDNVKIMADYVQTAFDGGASGALPNQVLDRETEKAFLTRFQVAF